ncbi:MAG TPA: DNA polymerase III subunit alpha, partial [Paenibacillaceae bacterium]|nr:DNA polymerase III subunit alpha [Paenibacillaceae bacterium]
KFVLGCLSQGYAKDLANLLYDWIVRFADYGFNRSHSAAYALIAYQTGYLKANYPVYYFTSMLQMVAGNLDKVAEYIEECRRQSITILPPNINQGKENFSVEKGAIRFGLYTIKNVGMQAVKHIIDVRKDGEFKDLYDFCKRVDLRIVNRRVMESLIYSGAMDSFPGHRGAFLAALDDVMEWGTKIREHNFEDQLILFGVGTLEQPPHIPQDLPPFSQKEKLEQEKETLGLYVSGHPLDGLRQFFNHLQFTPVIQLQEKKEDQIVELVGLVKELKIISTKKGQPMAFLEMEDPTGKIEVIVFPGIFNTYSHLLKKEKLLMIKGRINLQDNRRKVIAQMVSIVDLHSYEKKHKAVFIKIGKELESDQGKMNALKEKLLHSHGNCPVLLFYETSRKTLRLNQNFSIELNENMKNDLEKIVGIGCIVAKDMKI